MKKQIKVYIRVKLEKQASWYSYDSVCYDELNITLPISALGAMDFTQIVEGLAAEVMAEGENKLAEEQAESEDDDAD